MHKALSFSNKGNFLFRFGNSRVFLYDLHINWKVFFKRPLTNAMTSRQKKGRHVNIEGNRNV